jgi:hypothetical protein
MPMPNYRNTNYTLVYLWLAIGVIGCLLVAGPRLFQPALDNLIGDFNLRSFEKAFQGLQHPPESEYLDSRFELGDFGGSRQGCDLFLGEIRRYTGSQEIVLASYQEQDVRGHALQVVFLEGDQIPGAKVDSLPAPLDTLSGWELPPGVNQGSLYLVYMLILDDEGELKFNCP